MRRHRTWIRWFPEQAGWPWVAAAFLAVFLLGVVDYVTGWEISFSIFYLVPISMMAWSAGRRVGLVLSVASAITWLIADLLWVHSHGLIPYWNALVRLGFFAIVTLALSSLRDARDEQAETMHFVIHDLRSPLTNVMAGLELMSGDSGTFDATAQREMLTIAAVSGQQLVRLIDSLLDVARMEGGQMPIQAEDIPVAQITDAALAQVSLWARHAGVGIVTELPRSASLVHADAALTGRVLSNLLSNAMRYSPPGTTVVLRVAPADNGMVAFRVADQGPGIPKEWLGHVFGKFSQVRARNSGVAIGSGLGLTFAKVAVEVQDGRIWIESEVGKGTTVTFTLPAGEDA